MRDLNAKPLPFGIMFRRASFFVKNTKAQAIVTYDHNPGYQGTQIRFPIFPDTREQKNSGFQYLQDIRKLAKSAFQYVQDAAK